MIELPPGPWRAEWPYADVLEKIVDRDGEEVIGVYGADDSLAVDPEILRAIEALPGLVAAARAVLELHEFGVLAIGSGELPKLAGDKWHEVPRRFIDLRESLNRIDGEPSA